MIDVEFKQDASNYIKFTATKDDNHYYELTLDIEIRKNENNYSISSYFQSECKLESFISFYNAVNEANQNFNNEAKLLTSCLKMELKLKPNKLGEYEVNCRVEADVDDNFLLEFELGTDQSYIQKSLKQMEGIIKIK